MKVATFNINNINKRLDNLLAWLAKAEPDVVSLQELKAEQDAGAGRGNRTPTVLSDLRILSPLRLPISPSRLGFILA